MPHFSGLQLQSLVTAAGELQIFLQPTATPQPGPDDVVVRIEATPINPSDIGLLFGAADLSTLVPSGTAASPVVTMRIPAQAMKSLSARIGIPLPVGNEGAGVVVAAGSSAAAQALLGKKVAVVGGAMYAQFRCLKVEQCMELPEGASCAEGASCFVNPLTALGMVETMRREGHTALVHTAAASNLGQMLNRICIQDHIGLVNIVRKPDQAVLLKELGARHVCDTSSPTFAADLTQALVETGATMAFDATGGGDLASQILNCMESALSRHASEYSRYGSTTHKQVYIYGGLDTRPTQLVRHFGFSWGVGGWLLFTFLQRVGKSVEQTMRHRVAAELHTTFASRYSREISLQEALQPESIAAYGQRATGTKYLINPNKT